MTQRRRKKPQGPATSFVVACALAAVAGALGYKLPAQKAAATRARPRQSQSGAAPFGFKGAVFLSYLATALIPKLRRFSWGETLSLFSAFPATYSPQIGSPDLRLCPGLHHLID